MVSSRPPPRGPEEEEENTRTPLLKAAPRRPAASRSRGKEEEEVEPSSPVDREVDDALLLLLLCEWSPRPFSSQRAVAARTTLDHLTATLNCTHEDDNRARGGDTCDTMTYAIGVDEKKTCVLCAGLGAASRERKCTAVLLLFTAFFLCSSFHERSIDPMSGNHHHCCLEANTLINPGCLLYGLGDQILLSSQTSAGKPCKWT